MGRGEGPARERKGRESDRREQPARLSPAQPCPPRRGAGRALGRCPPGWRAAGGGGTPGRGGAPSPARGGGTQPRRRRHPLGRRDRPPPGAMPPLRACRLRYRRRVPAGARLPLPSPAAGAGTRRCFPASRCRREGGRLAIAPSPAVGAALFPARRGVVPRSARRRLPAGPAASRSEGPGSIRLPFPRPQRRIPPRRVAMGTESPLGAACRGPAPGRSGRRGRGLGPGKVKMGRAGAEAARRAARPAPGWAGSRGAVSACELAGEGRGAGKRGRPQSRFPAPSPACGGRFSFVCACLRALAAPERGHVACRRAVPARQSRRAPRAAGASSRATALQRGRASVTELALPAQHW